MTFEERYLGDGVYASFDGYQIWLKVARDYGKQEIALEPPVYAALLRYVSDLNKEKQAEESA